MSWDSDTGPIPGTARAPLSMGLGTSQAQGVVTAPGPLRGTLCRQDTDKQRTHVPLRKRRKANKRLQLAPPEGSGLSGRPTLHTPTASSAHGPGAGQWTSAHTLQDSTTEAVFLPSRRHQESLENRVFCFLKYHIFIGGKMQNTGEQRLSIPAHREKHR